MPIAKQMCVQPVYAGPNQQENHKRNFICILILLPWLGAVDSVFSEEVKVENMEWHKTHLGISSDDTALLEIRYFFCLVKILSILPHFFCCIVCILWDMFFSAYFPSMG